MNASSPAVESATRGFRGMILTLLMLPISAAVGQERNAPHRTFGVACTVCHTTESWTTLRSDIAFDHAVTDFPLDGRHAEVDCGGCHPRVPPGELRSACASCHADPHKAEFGDACGDCHTPAGWRSPAREAERHDRTRFPLLGRHRLLPCTDCHANQQVREYANTPSDCFACHAEAYAAAKAPDHAAGGFDRNCLACHTTQAWKPAVVDHEKTRFPLAGAHRLLVCTDCHVNDDYALVYGGCVQCHQADYASAVSPDHIASQFGADCLQCHSQTSWRPAAFDHGATRFPLLGAHATLSCTVCHAGGNYRLVYADCFQCHEQEFNSARNPDHTSAGFSRDCLLCHTQNSWKPAAFDHAKTKFPLAGAHAMLECRKCHVNGNYSIAYVDCYQCHEADYAQALTPANHQALQLDHDCLLCHSQAAWNPAAAFRASHSQNYPAAFPIYSGSRHAYPSRWNSCDECHTADRTDAFCCTQACHKSVTELANKHRGEPNYVYSCTSCATCHPSGKGD